MLDRFFWALKWRLTMIIILLHLGLAFGIVGMWQSAAFIPPATLTWLGLGIGSLYSAFLMTALFILIPAWPWMQRARKLKEWRTWAFEILPQVLAVIPVIITAVRVVRHAWRQYEKTGDFSFLDPSHLGEKIRSAKHRHGNGHSHSHEHEHTNGQRHTHEHVHDSEHSHSHGPAGAHSKSE